MPRTLIVLFTLARIVFNTSYRMLYPFLAVFARGLGVDLGALSLAFSARSVAGAAAVFVAPVADRRGRKPAMLLGAGVFTLSMLLVAVHPSFATFFAALPLSTLGTYIFLPSMQAFLGDRVPYQQRGMAMAATELSWSLSFILGVPAVGWLIAHGGWMTPFGVLAGLGLLALALLAWRVPHEAPPASGSGSFWKNVRGVITHPAALAGLAFSLLITTANETINLVFGVWMEDSFGLQLAGLGAASAVIGLSELAGESLSGGLVDRLGKERSVALGVTLNGLAALALPWIGRSTAGALAGLFLFYLSFEFTMVSLLPLLSELAPAARATMMALNVSAFALGRAIGAGIAAPLYQFGMLGCALASLGINLLALAVLRYVKPSNPE